MYIEPWIILGHAALSRQAAGGSVCNSSHVGRATNRYCIACLFCDFEQCQTYISIVVGLYMQTRRDKFPDQTLNIRDPNSSGMGRVGDRSVGDSSLE